MTPEEGKLNLDRLAALYTNRELWDARAQLIRETILKGAKLDPNRDRQQLNPIHRDHKTLDGYTVENVAFESFPGFWVTGNLYRPVTGHVTAPPCDSPDGGIPAILCPHGHWQEPDNYGRFRSDMQYRCATFARMGAVTFAYDMVGYGECDQVEHGFADALSLQLWNSIRCVDFMCSLAEVDTNRIGVTGASGGATQTILLTGVDDRIALSVPVVMVSAHSDGGCSCEIGMPIRKNDLCETNNVEIAALAAPKPMLLISDGDDWSLHTPEVEYPFIRRIYEFYGTTEHVACSHFPDEKHDYGFSKREAAYRFIAEHFEMDLSRALDGQGKIDEGFVSLLPRSDMEVFRRDDEMVTNRIVGNERIAELFARYVQNEIENAP